MAQNRREGLPERQLRVGRRSSGSMGCTRYGRVRRSRVARGTTELVETAKHAFPDVAVLVGALL